MMRFMRLTVSGVLAGLLIGPFLAAGPLPPRAALWPVLLSQIIDPKPPQPLEQFPRGPIIVPSPSPPMERDPRPPIEEQPTPPIRENPRPPIEHNPIPPFDNSRAPQGSLAGVVASALPDDVPGGCRKAQRGNVPS